MFFWCVCVRFSFFLCELGLFWTSILSRNFLQPNKIVRFSSFWSKSHAAVKEILGREGSEKEFLDILARGKRNLQISFTEKVRKRNLFTGYGEHQKRSDRTQKQMTKKDKSNEQKTPKTQISQQQITTNTVNSSEKYQPCPQKFEKQHAQQKKKREKLFRNTFATLSQHFRHSFTRRCDVSQQYRSTLVTLSQHFRDRFSKLSPQFSPGNDKPLRSFSKALGCNVRTLF